MKHTELPGWFWGRATYTLLRQVRWDEMWWTRQYLIPGEDNEPSEEWYFKRIEQ